MSHKATLWALEQRSIKGTTKIVLWHLCDRYNPEHGCFPSQELLAHDCQVSRSGLNNHLNRLEKCGLMRRERRIDPITRRQMSTRYILGFEEGFTPETCQDLADTPADVAPTTEKPCPDYGHGGSQGEPCTNKGLASAAAEKPCPDYGQGAVSRKQAEPCPENAQSRVQNLDTNLVREPLSKPVKEEEGAQAREAAFEDFFGELLSTLGLDSTALPGWWQGWPARAHVRRWIDDLGLDEDAVLAVSQASRRDHPEPPDGPKALDRAMQRAAARLKQTGAALAQKGSAIGVSDGGGGGGRTDANRSKRDNAPRPSEDELAAFYADLVNSDRYLPANTINNTLRDAMLTRSLVTPERLRMRGVR